MVFIHASIQFYIFRRQVNTLLEIIFIICLVHVSFKFFKNLWVINVVNRTICIYLKHHFKGIILIIVVYRSEFIQNSSTEINHIWVIFNIRNCGTAAHYSITMKNTNIMYALFEYQEKVLRARESQSSITKHLDR